MANRIWLNAVAPFEVRKILWFVNPVEQAKLTRVETPSTRASRGIEQWRGQCFGRDSCPLQLIVTAVIYFAVFQTDTASFVSSGFRVGERLWSRLKEIHVDCCWETGWRQWSVVWKLTQSYALKISYHINPKLPSRRTLVIIAVTTLGHCQVSVNMYCYKLSK